MTKNILFITTVIVFLLGCFGLNILSYGFFDYIYLIVILFMAFPFVQKRTFYGNLIYLFVLFLTISCIYSWRFNGQNIVKVIGHSYYYYALIFYFVLLKNNLSSNKVFAVLRIVALLFCFCYVLQWIIYPTVLFAGAEDENAITVEQYRARLPGSLCCYLLFMYGLNYMILKKNVIYLGYVVLGFVPIVIQGFRSLTVLSVLAAFLMIPFVVRSFKKTIIYMFLGVSFGLLGLSTALVSSKIEEMMERQERNETFDNDNYIRFLSFDYYWNQQFTKPYEKVIGGGLPVDTDSNYGKSISYTSEYNGFYWIDLGIIGLSMVIGIPAVLILVILYIRCMWKCKEPSLQFVRFTLFVVLIGSIFTSMELYRNGNILLFSILLYLEYKYHQEKEMYKLT